MGSRSATITYIIESKEKQIRRSFSATEDAGEVREELIEEIIKTEFPHDFTHNIIQASKRGDVPPKRESTEIFLSRRKVHILSFSINGAAEA